MAKLPMIDDSAGSYGVAKNPDGMSMDAWLRAQSSDVKEAIKNAIKNMTGALSPIGTSPEGNMSLQVPPMVSGIADSYSRLAGTPSQPGNAYNLSGVPELDAPIQGDMSNVLLSLYGGNALNPLARRPVGSVGAGMRAPDVRSDWDGSFGGFTAYAPNGKAAAYADVLNRGEGLEIANITSFPEYRGQGYAKSIVDQVRRDANGPVRVSPMTEEGRGFFAKNYGVRDDGTLFSDKRLKQIIRSRMEGSK